jgi:membrane-associated protein
VTHEEHRRIIEITVEIADHRVPVIAGASGMRYPAFLAYDVLGATAWGVGLTVVGFHLGGVSFVGAHLELVVVLIAVLSALPVTVSVIRGLLRRRAAASAPAVSGPV